MTQEFIEIRYTPEEVCDLLNSLSSNTFVLDLNYFSRDRGVPKYKQFRIIERLKQSFYSVDLSFYPERLRSFFLEQEEPEFKIVGEFLHCTAYEDVPLFINDPFLCEFVKWRLGIGR